MKRRFTGRRTDRPNRVTVDAPISRLVSRPGVGIERRASLAEAAGLMRMQGVSSLLVDGGSAIVTERDIARSIGAGGDPGEPVGSVATPHPLIVDGSLTVMECGGIMLDEEVRHVLVTMPDGFTGVVSQRDIVTVLVREADPELWAARERVPSENWLG